MLAHRHLSIRHAAVFTVAALVLGLLTVQPSVAVTDSGTHSAARTGGRVVFDAEDGTHGRELWSTDLTGSGTFLIHDTDPRQYSDLDSDTDLSSYDGGPTYYEVDGSESQIFRTDGTVGGEELVTAPANGLSELLAIGGGLAFVDGNNELWFVADDSTTPTLVTDDVSNWIAPAHGGGLLFKDSGVNEVWYSDGTAGGTVKLGATPEGPYGSYVTPTQTYFWTSSAKAYVTDGTAGDLHEISTPDLEPLLVDGGAFVGDRLVTAMYTATHGVEPYVIDGTSATRLADIAPGSDDSNVRGFAGFGGVVVFAASPDDETIELWATDGTPAGTAMVTTLPSNGNAISGTWTGAGADSFAVILNDDIDDAVFVTDGTVEGTFASGGEVGSELVAPVVVDDRVLFFAAATSAAGTEPWISDGTPDGTHPLTEVHPSPSIDEVMVADSMVYVLADTGSQYGAVWRVDRTNPLGSPPELVDEGADELLAVFGDDLVWRDAFDYMHYDAGTKQVTEISMPASAASPQVFAHDDGMYVSRSSSAVYHVDLSGAGPYAFGEVISTADDLSDIVGGYGGYGITFGEDLVFYAEDTSDGSAAKVFRYDLSMDSLTPLTSAGDISRGINFTKSDAHPGHVFFEGQNSSKNSETTDEVWFSDGTMGGTDELAITDGLEVQQFAIAPNGTLVIPADGTGGDADGHADVYAVTDPLGTPSLATWSDTVGESGFDDPRIDTVLPVQVGGSLASLAIVEDNPNGDHILALISPSGPDTYFPQASRPEDLTRLAPAGGGTYVMFSATSDAVGRELWAFDPFSKSVAATDLLPGGFGSVPRSLQLGSLWFAAGSTAGANDLWYQSSPASAPINVTAPTAVDDDATTYEQTPVEIDLIDNDSPRAGSTLTLEWADGASHGTVAIGSGGTVVYTPEPGFVGSDEFTYRISDDLSIDHSTVTVNVEFAAPPTAADDTATTDEGVDVTIDVLDNDSPGPEAPAALSLVSVTSPAGGSTKVVSGKVAYTPGEYFSGTDTFDYVVSDGRKQSTGTVTVTVSELPAEMDRVSGSTRADTAIAVAGVSHADGADVVLLARQDAYPDALAGAPLAYALDAPILLTRRDALLDEVGTAIADLGPTRVILLGGLGALSQDVEDAVSAINGVTTVDRIGGSNRFETSAMIAAGLPGSPTAAYITEGANADPRRGWPDALSVSPLAAAQGRPILLVSRDGLPTATATAFDDLGITDAQIVGGEAAVSAAVSDAIAAAGVTVGQRLSGPSRYATSVAVASAAVANGADPDLVWFATGLNFPDALVAGPAVAKDGGVMLLVHGKNPDGSPDSLGWLDTYRNDPIERVRILGGIGAISDEVSAAIEAKLT